MKTYKSIEHHRISIENHRKSIENHNIYIYIYIYLKNIQKSIDNQRQVIGNQS